MRRVARLWIAITAAVFAACAPEAGDPTTVFVVRHSEKVSEASDAVLSEVGWNRAADLLGVMEDAEVSALYASQYARAQQTVEPIAERFGLEIQIHDASDSEGLAARILADHAGEVVLVSGHSNTVPGIVAALGAPEPAAIADWDYDDLFVVTVGAGREARYLHLSYGDPSEPPAEL
jgi:broad specificity phosphatase PhoE